MDSPRTPTPFLTRGRFAFLLGLAAGTSAAGGAWGDVIDRVVASVNGDPILWSEFENQRVLMVHQGLKGDGGKILDVLIEDRLLKQEAKRLQGEHRLEASGAEVEEEYKRHRDRFNQEFLRQKEAPATDEDFKAELAASGLTEDSLKDRIRSDLLSRKLVRSEVAEKLVVTDKDVEASFQAHKADFESPALLKMLVLRTKEESQIRKAIAEMKSGKKTLADVIKKYGDKENQARSEVEMSVADMTEPLAHGLEKLNVGEVSDVIHDNDLWFMIKILDRVPGRQLTLGDSMVLKEGTVQVREVIRRKLWQDAWSKAYDEWLGRLRTAAAIDKKPLN